VELAQKAGVKALAIFHLYPGHDDAFLKAAEAEMQAVMPTAFMARERQCFTFEPALQESVPERPEPVLAQANEG
jgi:ribonuclease BN (tRNA processing enzyme)